MVDDVDDDDDARGGADRRTPVPSPITETFLHRWRESQAAERANYQLFLSELCDLLNVPRPEPTRPDDRDNVYVPHIRLLGESLDAHHKRQQSAHPGLTITDMYNVLVKLRTGEPFTDKDRRVHEQGLVSVLRQIHDDLDAAVADAYGWPVDLPDDELLKRLVALNAERAAEERQGKIRYLRPDFQNPGGAGTVQGDLELKPAAEGSKGKKATAAKKTAWPKTLAEQARAVRTALQTNPNPVTPGELVKSFAGTKEPKVAELLETLASLGQARIVEGGRYSG